MRTKYTKPNSDPVVDLDGVVGFEKRPPDHDPIGSGILLGGNKFWPLIWSARGSWF